MGGTILKTQLGTATLSDLDQLHGTIDELKSKEVDIVHSLANQLTYVKGLGQNTRINTDAISNMSSIVKNELVHSHDRYVQLTRDVMWLNLTLFNQSALFTIIGELEYALLQLTHQVDELLMAVQYTLSGKLPITILGPSVLHSILRNISLCLPGNYEPIASTKLDTIHLYYELIKVTAVGTAHGIKLILEVPLKTESQHFTLFRIIALPTRVLNDTFVLYQLEYNYFGLSYSQRDYILMTAANVQKCSTGSIAICPADRALYDIRSITCESKLYFQTATKDGPCRRSLMLHYETPTLLRHGEVWIYHFPSQRQVTIRCPRNHVWVTHTLTLSGAGLIHSATTCLITSGEIRTLPELRSVMHANLNAPSVYVPDNFPILLRHELPRVEAALTPEVNDLDQLKDRLATAQKSLDVDTLVHIQKTTFPQGTLPHWHLILAAVSCTFTGLLVLYVALRPKLQCSTSYCLRTDKSPEGATPRSLIHPSPASEHPTTAAYLEQLCDSVTFATYALPCKN